MQNLCCGLYGLRWDCWVVAAGRKDERPARSANLDASYDLRSGRL
jgi:hypothetical protein